MLLSCVASLVNTEWAGNVSFFSSLNAYNALLPLFVFFKGVLQESLIWRRTFPWVCHAEPASSQTGHRQLLMDQYINPHGSSRPSGCWSCWGSFGEPIQPQPRSHCRQSSRTPLIHLQLGGDWQDHPPPISPAWAKLSHFLNCFYGRDGVK